MVSVKKINESMKKKPKKQSECVYCKRIFLTDDPIFNPYTQETTGTQIIKVTAEFKIIR